MRVVVQHRSRYHYPRPALLGPQLIRLRPADHTRARIESYQLLVEPEHRLHWLRDPHGNRVARVTFKAGQAVSELERAGRARGRDQRDQSVRFLHRRSRAQGAVRLSRRAGSASRHRPACSCRADRSARTIGCTISRRLLSRIGKVVPCHASAHLVETGIGIIDGHDADQAVDSGPACVSQRRRRGATPAPLDAGVQPH